MDRLEEIFNHKRKSSEEFREVQRKNGLLLAPENLRADPATREGAIEIHKGIHWINLELAEFMFAQDQNKPEELADVLHFLVELALLLGFDHTIIHEEPGVDRWDIVIGASEGDPLVFADPATNARFMMIASLRLADVIKNKPWKQTLKPAPERELIEEMLKALFYWFGAIARTAKYSPQSLFDQFVWKDEINHERVSTGV